jgi:Protein of unknown function (DUF3969)
MNEESPSQGVKFVAVGGQDAQRLIAVLGLGMARALALGLVTPSYASHRLFRNALVQRLRACHAPEGLIETADLATELEPIQRLVPSGYRNSLERVEAQFAYWVASLPSPEPQTGDRWQVYLDEDPHFAVRSTSTSRAIPYDSPPMNEESPSQRVKFVAVGGQDAQRLIAVLGLGMARALALGLVTPSYACHKLFKPALVQRLRACHAPDGLIETAELAMELEDVESLVPRGYRDSVARVEAQFAYWVGSLPSPEPQTGDRWQVGLDEDSP